MYMKVTLLFNIGILALQCISDENREYKCEDKKGQTVASHGFENVFKIRLFFIIMKWL